MFHSFYLLWRRLISSLSFSDAKESSKLFDSILGHVLIWVSCLGLANFTHVVVFQICADGFTVTFPIPPIGENLSLSVFGEAMEPLFLSLYEASGGLLFVLPLCLTDQCWCFSVQRCKTSCRFFYSYTLKFCCLMSFFYVCSW